LVSGLIISSHNCFLKPQENVTIRVRRSSLGRLWNALGAHAALRHWNGQSGAPVAERVSGGREPDPQSQIKGRLLLSEGEKATLAEIAHLSLANCYFTHNSSGFPSCYDSARSNLLVLFILWFAKAAAETQNGAVLGRVVLLRLSPDRARRLWRAPA
jgi:hypothetical protein